MNNAELSFRLIRNEKVGCSIHLSGTNQNKHLAQPTRLGFVVSGVLLRALQTEVLRFVPQVVRCLADKIVE